MQSRSTGTVKTYPKSSARFPKVGMSSNPSTLHRPFPDEEAGLEQAIDSLRRGQGVQADAVFRRLDERLRRDCPHLPPSATADHAVADSRPNSVAVDPRPGPPRGCLRVLAGAGHRRRENHPAPGQEHQKIWDSSRAARM